jgi:hypothetical protein
VAGWAFRAGSVLAYPRCVSDPAEHAEPTDARSDPRLLRASDTDRNRVAEALHEAAGEGRLTLDELQDRLDATYAAKTYADLEPVLADLPSAGAGVVVPVVDTRAVERRSGAVARPAGVVARGEGPDTRLAVAVMSGAVRRGPWLVPRTQVAVAVMGGVDIDLREARFSSDEVTIHAYALMGGVDVTVPEWMEVHVDGIGFMGGFDDRAGEPTQPPPPGAPVVRLIGFAFMGGVSVRRKPPKPPKRRRNRSTTS